jgi:hypothetical protein
MLRMCLAVIFGTTLYAQSRPPIIDNEFRKDWEMSREFTVAVADAMPV